MPKLEVTEEQLRVIQDALEFYGRVGIGQFTYIAEHPTFEKYIASVFKNEAGQTDWSKYHTRMDAAKMGMLHGRNLLINDMEMPLHGNWGLYHPDVDESCRVAFDIEKLIRHEKWKQNPDRSEATVDAYLHLTTEDSDKIKIEL